MTLTPREDYHVGDLLVLTPGIWRTATGDGIVAKVMRIDQDAWGGLVAGGGAGGAAPGRAVYTYTSGSSSPMQVTPGGSGNSFRITPRWNVTVMLDDGSPYTFSNLEEVRRVLKKPPPMDDVDAVVEFLLGD